VLSYVFAPPLFEVDRPYRRPRYYFLLLNPPWSLGDCGLLPRYGETCYQVLGA